MLCYVSTVSCYMLCVMLLVCYVVLYTVCYVIYCDVLKAVWCVALLLVRLLQVPVSQSALRNLVWRQFGQFGRPSPPAGLAPPPIAFPPFLMFFDSEWRSCYVVLCYVVTERPSGWRGRCPGWAGPSSGVMRVPGSGADSADTVAATVALLAFLAQQGTDQQLSLFSRTME